MKNIHVNGVAEVSENCKVMLGRSCAQGAEAGVNGVFWSLQAERGLDLAEGADRSDKGAPGDSPMDIAGLSLPNTASMDNLHGHNQSHPFNSAGLAKCSGACNISSISL